MVSEADLLVFVDGLKGEKRVEERNFDEDRMHAEGAKIFWRGEKIFLVMHEDTLPLRIELRCDGKLGKLLRENYESVLLSRTLGGNGIEVICSGQMDKDEILDLLRLSWEMSGK